MSDTAVSLKRPNRRIGEVSEAFFISRDCGACVCGPCVSLHKGEIAQRVTWGVAGLRSGSFLGCTVLTCVVFGVYMYLLFQWEFGCGCRAVSVALIVLVFLALAIVYHHEPIPTSSDCHLGSNTHYIYIGRIHFSYVLKPKWQTSKHQKSVSLRQKPPYLKPLAAFTPCKHKQPQKAPTYAHVPPTGITITLQPCGHATIARSLSFVFAVLFRPRKRAWGDVSEEDLHPRLRSVLRPASARGMQAARSGSSGSEAAERAW